MRPLPRPIIWSLLALLYAALTAVFTWPLITHLSTTLASDLGDPALNTWILWWNAHAIPLTDRWWNAPIFWPATGALGLSELLLGISAFTTPMQWLGASPVTAYNAAVFLSFPLSALAAHALGYSLTRRHDAGMVAGLIYGFTPIRADHLSQLQVLTSYCMPLALCGLHQYLRERRTRWLAVFALAWLLQAVSNGYFLLFFPVLAGLWMLWFVPPRRDPRGFAAIAVAWVVGSLPLIPIALKYRELHAAFDFQRTWGEIVSFSANAASFLDTTPLLKFWHFNTLHQPEGAIFPGFAPLLLVGAAVAGWLGRVRVGQRPAKLSVGLAVLGVVFVAAGVRVLVAGPWIVAVNGITLVSITVAGKPFSQGALLLLVALAIELGLRTSFRPRSALTFYVLATGVLYWLTLGPEPRLFSTPIVRWSPYSWLMMLPGFDALRVPARFAMVAVVSLSAAAALAFARLTQRAGSAVRVAAAIIMGGVALADGWMDHMPLVPLPVRLQALEVSGVPPVVLELPLGDFGQDTSAMYRAMFHGKALVNGYSGFSPKHFDLLRYALREGDLSVLDAIAETGPFEIVVDSAGDPGGRSAAALAQRPGVVSAGSEGGRQLFIVTAATTRAHEAGTPLPIASVSASADGSHASSMIDGDPGTRWSTGGPQHGGETVTVDLGQVRSVTGLTLAIGPHLGDYPRDLAIATSTDAATWENRWAGRTLSRTFDAAIRDPRRVPLSFVFGPAPARWIRLTQNGSDPVQYWSIIELAVTGPATP